MKYMILRQLRVSFLAAVTRVYQQSFVIKGVISSSDPWWRKVRNSHHVSWELQFSNHFETEG